MAGTWFWAFIISTVLLLLMTGLFLVYVSLAGKAGKTIVKSRLKRTPLILLWKKGKMAEFITGKVMGGTLDHPKYGTFLFRPEDMVIFNKTTLSQAYEEVGHTVSLEFLQTIKRLRESGIMDIEQAEALEEKIKKQLADDEEKTDKEKMTTEDNTFLTKTLDSIHYITDYFKYALNPTHINEKVSNEVRLAQGLTKKDNSLMWGGILAAVLIAGGIAIYLVATSVGISCDYSGYKEAVRICEQGAKVVTGYTTGGNSIV